MWEPQLATVRAENGRSQAYERASAFAYNAVLFLLSSDRLSTRTDGTVRRCSIEINRAPILRKCIAKRDDKSHWSQAVYFFFLLAPTKQTWTHSHNTSPELICALLVNGLPILVLRACVSLCMYYIIHEHKPQYWPMTKIKIIVLVFFPYKHSSLTLF